MKMPACPNESPPRASPGRHRRRSGCQRLL